MLSTKLAKLTSFGNGTSSQWFDTIENYVQKKRAIALSDREKEELY